MVYLSFRNAYTAYERQYKKLLNVYIAIIKGWIKSTNANIRKEITSKLMSIIPNQCALIPFSMLY